MKLLSHILQVALLLFLTQVNAAETIHLNAVNLSSTEAQTRIVFTFDKKVLYHPFTLKNPDRVVVDLPNTSLTTSLNTLSLQKSTIQNIRLGLKEANVLRIVLEVKAARATKIFALPSANNSPYRLVIDIYGSSERKNLEISQALTTNKNPLDPPWKLRPLRPIIVVIDPGHGGKDPGAIGTHRVKEKDVVLAISRYLQEDLNKITNVHAVLTRNGDYYISLRERLNIARKTKADFFIAIHADAYKHNHANGASVFALSDRGATSEAARWLAEKENYSELGGVNLSDKSQLLRSVLLDLSQTATISQSLDIGQTVLQSLANLTSLHRGRVEQARFVVLKSPDIPSLLVETGFLSNPLEENRLQRSDYQHLLAHAVTLGIQRYFWHHPKIRQSYRSEG